MSKKQAYIEALEMAIRVLDTAFARANAAEVVRPATPVSELWQMSEDERAEASRLDIVRYDVEPDHWGARLALMSAFESLHAALRVVASNSAAFNPKASAWRDAAGRAQEAARLAEEAMRTFQEARLPPVVPAAAPGDEAEQAKAADSDPRSREHESPEGERRSEGRSLFMGLR